MGVVFISRTDTPPQPRTMSAHAVIGKPAPDFDEEAVLGQDFTRVKLSDFKGKYLVLFFYPLDFTFVCPTEILAFSDRADEFRKINAEVVGVSVDSKYSHLAWINTLNDAPVGRSVDETLRLVQAFQYVDEHGEVCPVNWTPGSATMKADPKQSLAYFEKVKQ